MAKIEKTTITEWTNLMVAWLSERGLSMTDVKTGSDVWAVWVRAVNNPLNVYKAMPDVTDGHIQTALEKIFPAIEFKDPKRY